MSGKHSRWAGAAAIIAGLAVAGGGTILQAEDEGPMCGGVGKHHGRRGFGRMAERQMLRQIDLSDQQRGQIKEILKAEREGMKEQRQALAERRRALHEAVRSGAEEWELREKANDLGLATGDLAVKLAAVHGQIEAILTDEQRQSLGELRTKMQERMKERRGRMHERMQERGEGFGGDRPFLDFLEP
jgi:protein CpxP